MKLLLDQNISRKLIKELEDFKPRLPSWFTPASESPPWEKMASIWSFWDTIWYTISHCGGMWRVLGLLIRGGFTQGF